ncbi:hypothetical protein [Pseudorhodoferax sp. Leaf267]|uniref:hypothetical protein n=1 Tax=Pseudorhodoferax sp. Leaf267 TaxID=1736316 RepID=UPI0012E2EE8B|nr:hypothetical protein [Pseudorhodoferax sp. Leaf267]
MSIHVRLDVQRGLLLEMTGRRRRGAWCVLERTMLPARWADLRRALYATASAAAPERGTALPP